MITKFKLFEKYDTEDLIDYVDLDIIDDIFDKKYHVDIDDAIYSWPNLIWDNIDNDRFVEDFTRDYIDSQTIDDIYEDDLKKYIDENLSTKKKKKIRELYLKENEDVDEEERYDSDDYENMMSELDEDQLREVILVDEDSYDVIQSIFGNTYDGYTAKELIEEFWGIDTEFYNKQNRYSWTNNNYDENVKSLKKVTMGYLDKKGIEKDVKNNEDDEYKKEFVKEFIFNNKKLQKNILANNKSKVLDLFDLITSETGNNIGDTYKFQKAYIEEYTKENPDYEDDDMIVPTALKNIYDNFTLHPKILKEYPDDMILISTSKFNI